ncbi:hypothetical protein GGS20DRAFT_555056 [Poronia punctata]|nr:hypothetical protein GGS20DRAFT_555056 [Poronia punctata]
MEKEGVRPTLDKYGYKCSHARDAEFLTSWLELLVLLRRLPLHMDIVRKLIRGLAWRPGGWKYYDIFHLSTDEGILDLEDGRHMFTPFPRWIGPPKLIKPL